MYDKVLEFCSCLGEKSRSVNDLWKACIGFETWMITFKDDLSVLTNQIVKN